MKELVKGIANYVEYLKKTGLKVSVHYEAETVKAIPTEIFDMLQGFNVHTNPYCMWVKRNDKNRCIDSQQRIIRECQCGFRTCYAGVKEYVIPFFKEKEAVGFIAVSGYRDKDAAVQNRELWESSLSDEPFPRELADTLILPLKIMLEKLFSKDFTGEKSEYNLILQYLWEYYATADLDSVCKHFHRSRSHISHIFKKNSGMSLRAYCNLLKLESSRKMLSEQDSSVTQIAMDCGFSDVSYYINLFKKQYGVSPLVYRKSPQINSCTV